MTVEKRDLIMGIISLVVGLVCIFVLAGSRDKLKDRCTERVSGTVTSVMQSGTGEDATYDTTVEYEVSSRKYRQSQIASHESRRGESVTVWYDPDDPSVCYIESVNTSPFMFRLAGAVFSVVGAFMIVKNAVKLARQR